MYGLTQSLGPSPSFANASNRTSSITNQSDTLTATKDVIGSSTMSNPSNLDVVKQIKRINVDGSYTLGYEAEDGSFKIESRDVLGNVKGTFGFKDDEGEIKRISYSAINQTATKNSGKPVESSSSSLLPSSMKPYTTSIYSQINTTPLTTKETVIQSIPRRRTENALGSESTVISYDSSNLAHNVYPASKQFKNINIVLPVTTANPRPAVIIKPAIDKNVKKSIIEGQVDSPSDAESTTLKEDNIPAPTKIIYFTKNLSDKTNNIPLLRQPSHQVSFRNFNDNVKLDRKSNLHRKYNESTGVHYEAQEQIINYDKLSGDDAAHVYGGSFSTGNPHLMISTTASPRDNVFSALSARNRHSNYVPLKTVPQTIEYVQKTQEFPNKVVIKFPDIEHSKTSTENPLQFPTSHSQYKNLRNYDHYNSRGRVEHNHNLRRAQILRERSIVPLTKNAQRSEYHTTLEQVHDEESRYIHESSSSNQIPSSKDEHQTEHHPGAILHNSVKNPNIRLSYISNSYTPHQDFKPYQSNYVPILPFADYNQYSGENYNMIGLPLTTRDFQILLQQIIRKHRHGQNYNLHNSNPGFSEFDEHQVSHYKRVNSPMIFSAQQNIPYSMYRQAPIHRQKLEHREYEPLLSESSFNHKFSPRRDLPYEMGISLRPNPQERLDQSNVYLPAEVREALLLRMLMLALTPDGYIASSSINDKTTISPSFMKKKPVRSVQILGEESRPHTKRYEGEMQYEHPANF